MRETACRLNLASRDFDEAAEDLGGAAQAYLGGESLRQAAESEGKAVQAAAGAGGRPSTGRPVIARPRTRRAGRRRARVYLGSGGVMVPHVAEKEKRTRRGRARAERRRRGGKRRASPRAGAGADGPLEGFEIATLYGDAAERPLVSATRGDCEQAGRLVRRDAGRVGLDEAGGEVGVVDGSDWIENQAERQSPPPDALGPDFYHLAEDVHKARRVVFGGEGAKDEKAPGRVWVAGVLHTAKHEGYGGLRGELRAWKAALRGAGHSRAAGRVLNCGTGRRGMIRCPAFLGSGRQIGSGPAGSMGKATTRRIKGRAVRWDGVNAEGIMSPEALEQSGGRKAYWEAQLFLPA